MEFTCEENENILDKEKKNFKNISYSKRDVYYRRAKEEGFRARSVYKLKEINDNFKILHGASKIIDLCAAPGSWSQMLRLLTKNDPLAKIVSVDLQDIVPIEGIQIIKGDITKQETIIKILSYFNNEKVDVVIFDGAPDVTGLIDVDLYMQVQLIVVSLVICLKVLRKNGKFVAKVFKEGRGAPQSQASKSDFYYERVKVLFENVYYFKPASSRGTSHETYIICEGFGIDNNKIEEIVDKLTIEEIFNFRSLFCSDTNSESDLNLLETKRFLEFLCDGKY